MGEAKIIARAVLWIAVSVCLFQGIEAATESGQALPLKPVATVEYKADGLRDPFYRKEEEVVKKPEAEETAPPRPLPSLEVQGIVWGGSFPQAIINNKIVKIGDTLGEVNIVDINREGIVVLFDKRKYNISSPGAINVQKSFKNPEGGKK